MAATAIDALREQVRDLTEAVRNLERWAKALEPEKQPEKPKRWVIYQCWPGSNMCAVFTPTVGFKVSGCGFFVATFDTRADANTVINLLGLEHAVATYIEVEPASVDGKYTEARYAA